MCRKVKFIKMSGVGCSFLNECLPKAVDEVVSPVHLFGHSQLSHVHFSVNVV